MAANTEHPFFDLWSDLSDLSVATDRIRETRDRRAISFGSCSFDEPRDDLRGLGLLEMGTRT